MGLEQEIKCKICFLYENPISDINDLISPCNCKGSMKYVHNYCLKMWRYRGKSFEDTSKCCQCGVCYVIQGETSPGKILTFFSTVLISILIYFIGKILAHTIFDTIFMMVKDYCSVDEFEFFGFEDFNVSKFNFKRKSKLELTDFVTLNIHYFYVFLFMTIYMVFTYQNYFNTFNYLFTFWRLQQFNFILDQVLFISMSSYFFKFFFESLQKKVEGFYTYLLNYKLCRNDRRI